MVGSSQARGRRAAGASCLVFRGFRVAQGSGCFLFGFSCIAVTLLRCGDGHGLSPSMMAFRERGVVALMPCVVH